MKQLLQLIKTLRKDLGIIFVICSCIVILINFGLYDISKLKTLEKTETLIEKLCLSYISAFIFYFLVVHTKQQKDKKNIYKFVANNSFVIIATGRMIANDLAQAINIKLEKEFPTENEIIEICQKINPYSENSNFTDWKGNKFNWFEYFENYRIKTENEIQEIYIKMPFLDAKLVNHLSNIENNSFYSLTKAIVKIPFKTKNDSLINFWRNLFNYFEAIQSFELFYTKNIEKYK